MLVSFLSALMLVAVHLFAQRLRFLSAVPRSRWLSLAGGSSVAYVFVHLLPELSEHQETLQELPFLGFLEQHVYVIALVGLAIFYGLERLVEEDAEDGKRSGGVFWLHIASFAVYNALIGYLITQPENSAMSRLGLFVVAMALHLLVNDFGLRQHHQSLYDREGRWVLALAILVGWGGGLMLTVRAEAIAGLFAFLAGGIILNVLKEELPEERQSNFGAFALGATAYTVLLLI